MENNVITQIKSKKVHDMVQEILKDVGLRELVVESYEEFFSAITHVKPKLFIVEIDQLDNPYFKVIKILKKSFLTKDVPILAVVTSKDKEVIQRIAELELQAIVYPPITGEVIKLYISNIQNMAKCSESMQIAHDLKTVQSVMISGLASLAEYRDPETGEHIKRTQNYVKALATTLKRMGYYEEELTVENIEAMYMSVPLHDIGKVGIRDEILLKPGRLTEEEFEIMKTHARIGYETVTSVGNKLKNSTFLEYAADVAYTHHEKYDGSGYPRGLVGEDIPLIGRLMAVADVYDALTSKRVYKEAMTHNEAMAIIKDGVGKHFDPLIVDCAITLETTFQNIAHTYKDAEVIADGYLQLTDLRNQKLLEEILVVEDSRIVREITRNQLLAAGFKVDVAVDGRDGFNAIKKKAYDLVLLDIEMPRMNGYEMAMKVLELEKEPILVAMTAADYNITAQQLKKYNISGLILKPIDFNRLATIYVEVLRAQNTNSLRT